MPPNVLTLRELTESLSRQGLLADAERRRVEEHGGDVPATGPGMPWFLQAFVGAGAWLASLFILGFFFAAEIINFRAAQLIPCGLILVAGALALRWFFSNVFATQFCLAISVAGHLMVIGGAGEARELGGAALAAALLCGATYAIQRDGVHRFASVGTALALVTSWLVSKESSLAFYALIGAETAALVALFARAGTPRALLPAGYALAVSLPLSLVVGALPELKLAIQDAPSRLLAVAGLLWTIGWAAGGVHRLQREPVLLALGSAAIVGTLGVSGLPAAAILLVLGYARRDGVLISLGIAALAGFLCVYYYTLSVTLFDKSTVLLGSGALLLLLRALMLRRPWGREVAA